jgi:hypothetical protein
VESTVHGIFFLPAVVQVIGGSDDQCLDNQRSTVYICSILTVFLY